MGALQTKYSNFNLPQQLISAGIYPYFRVIESDQDTEVMIKGKKVLMFGFKQLPWSHLPPES